MKCAYCGSSKTEVFNSRTTRSGTQIWRRRRCMDCSETMTSYERIDLHQVISIDGGQPKKLRYSRPRLYISLLRAFEDSKDLDSVDSIIDTIEQRLLGLNKDIVTQSELVDAVLRTIKPISPTAFMKYLAEHSNLTGTRDLNKVIKKY
jgi:transcriptional regulator NrdR family protein